MTQGEKGCFCRNQQTVFHQPAFKVRNVVDTTGCGDVFHGAFIYGLLQNWSLRLSAEFACAVSSLKCRALGGRTGIPKLDEVKQFLRAEGSKEIRAII